MFLKYQKICWVIVMTIGFTGLASAKDKDEAPEAANQYIYTPTLQKDPSDLFTCRVVNIGKKSQTFDISILSSQGKSLESQAPALLQPGFTSSDSTNTKNTIGYCRVGVKGSAKDFLVTFCSQSATSSSCNAVVTGQSTATE